MFNKEGFPTDTSRVQQDFHFSVGCVSVSSYEQLATDDTTTRASQTPATLALSPALTHAQCLFLLFSDSNKHETCV